MHQAVARKLVVQADGKLSPRELAHEVTVLVEGLADRLNVRGVVPGHIKALVEENGFYAMFNCTRRGRRASSCPRAGIPPTCAARRSASTS